MRWICCIRKLYSIKEDFLCPGRLGPAARLELAFGSSVGLMLLHEKIQLYIYKPSIYK